MAQTDRKNTAAIRMVSGAPILIKADGAEDWENLGENVSAEIMPKFDTTSITLKNGAKVEKRTAESRNVKVTLAQANKAVLDRVDELAADDTSCEMYIPNGVENGIDQGFYFPEVKLSPNGTLKLDGNTHQALDIDFLVQPQSAAAAISNPNTVLPDEYPGSSSVAVTGENKFYVIIETTVSGDDAPEGDIGG